MQQEHETLGCDPPQSATSISRKKSRRLQISDATSPEKLLKSNCSSSSLESCCNSLGTVPDSLFLLKFSVLDNRYVESTKKFSNNLVRLNTSMREKSDLLQILHFTHFNWNVSCKRISVQGKNLKTTCCTKHYLARQCVV